MHSDERPRRRSERAKNRARESSLQPLLHWYHSLSFIEVTFFFFITIYQVSLLTYFFFFCIGATVVEWLIAKGKVRNRPEALMLATGLMNEGFLQPAGDLSKEGADSGEQAAFLDDTKALYYFVSCVQNDGVFFWNVPA